VAYPSANVHKWRHRTAERDGWTCRHCGVQLRCDWCQPDSLEPAATLDHFPIRLAGGGLNNLDNWALACGPCNNNRHDAERHRQKLAAPHRKKRKTIRVCMGWDAETHRFVYRDVTSQDQAYGLLTMRDLPP
jgi:5-methylcytosine-specific restriction endonuclease McrA